MSLNLLETNLDDPNHSYLFKMDFTTNILWISFWREA